MLLFFIAINEKRNFFRRSNRESKQNEKDKHGNIYYLGLKGATFILQHEKRMNPYNYGTTTIRLTKENKKNLTGFLNKIYKANWGPFIGRLKKKKEIYNVRRES